MDFNRYFTNQELEDTLNEWIADSAAVTGARTVDMYEHFKDHPEWFERRKLLSRRILDTVKLLEPIKSS